VTAPAVRSYLERDGAPYGYCGRCDRDPAVHRYGDGLVCQSCLPKDVLFAPFLGFQEDLMSRTERYILAGGGAGPGKTTVGSRLYFRQLFGEMDRHAKGEIEHSKGWAIFFRRLGHELLQVVEDFKRYYRRIDPAAEWNEQKKLCTFTCGYRVQFAGIEHDDDYLKFYGPEWTLLVIDEAAPFTEKMIEELDTRVRCPDPVLSRQLQTVLLTNPVGGATKQYLKRRFVKVADPRETVQMRVKLRSGKWKEFTQVYLPGNLYDNPSLMRDGNYEGNLLTKRSEVRRALLDNDWDVQEGTWVSDDWDPTIHICKPFTIPNGWFRFKSGDYGFSSKSSVQWWAVDPEGNMTCYRSLTVTGHTAEELGYRIREIEKRPCTAVVDGKPILIVPPEWDELRDCSTVYGPMDSSLWSRQGETGPSRGEILQNLGTGFFKADRSRESAAEQIRNRLRRRTPNAAGEMVIPGIRWFSTCKTRYKLKGGDWDETGPITSIPGLLADPDNPDLWDTTGDDHDMDAAGYGALYRMLVPYADTEDANQRILDEIRARRELGRPKTASGFPGMPW